jgi:hypothetical protein
MKVLSLRTYQAVTVGKKNYNTLNTTTLASAKYELIQGIGIKVQKDGSSLVVPFANISQFEIAEEEKVEKKSK